MARTARRSSSRLCTASLTATGAPAAVVLLLLLLLLLPLPVLSLLLLLLALLLMPLRPLLLTERQTNERRPLYDLEHGRRAIGYNPQQKSIVTEDFEAGRMEKDPVLHANL